MQYACRKAKDKPALVLAWWVTQRDPSGKDLPYSYAGCEPTNKIDPTGHDQCDVIAGMAGLLGAAAGGLIGLEIAGPMGAAVGGAAVGGAFANAMNTACANDDEDWGDIGESALEGSLFAVGGWAMGSLFNL